MNKRQQALNLYETLTVTKQIFESLTEEINLLIVQDSNNAGVKTSDILYAFDSTSIKLNKLMEKRSKVGETYMELVKDYNQLVTEYNKEKLDADKEKDKELKSLEKRIKPWGDKMWLILKEDHGATKETMAKIYAEQKNVCPKLIALDADPEYRAIADRYNELCK